MESLLAGYEHVDYNLDCSNCRLLSCGMSCCEGGHKRQVGLSAHESVRYKGKFPLCQNLWLIYFSLDYIYCAALHSQAVLNIERKTEQVKFADTADQLTSHLISPKNINNITWRRCSFLLYIYFFTCKLWSKLEWVIPKRDKNLASSPGQFVAYAASSSCFCISRLLSKVLSLD